MTGEELRQIRERTGLLATEFAEQLGIHAVSLSRFEREREPITRVVELAVCELSRRLGKNEKNPAKKSRKK